MTTYNKAYAEGYALGVKDGKNAAIKFYRSLEDIERAENKAKSYIN